MVYINIMKLLRIWAYCWGWCLCVCVCVADLVNSSQITECREKQAICGLKDWGGSFCDAHRNNSEMKLATVWEAGEFKSRRSTDLPALISAQISWAPEAQVRQPGSPCFILHRTWSWAKATVKANSPAPLEDSELHASSPTLLLLFF